MRFTELFETLTIVIESISRVHVRYDKELMKKILDDIFLNRLLVLSLRFQPSTKNLRLNRRISNVK